MLANMPREWGSPESIWTLVTFGVVSVVAFVFFSLKGKHLDRGPVLMPDGSGAEFIDLTAVLHSTDIERVEAILKESGIDYSKKETDFFHAGHFGFIFAAVMSGRLQQFTLRVKADRADQVKQIVVRIQSERGSEEKMNMARCQVHKRNGKYFIDYWHNGRRFREMQGTGREQVQGVLNKRLCPVEVGGRPNLSKSAIKSLSGYQLPAAISAFGLRLCDPRLAYCFEYAAPRFASARLEIRNFASKFDTRLGSKYKDFAVEHVALRSKPNKELRRGDDSRLKRLSAFFGDKRPYGHQHDCFLFGDGGR